MTESTADNRPGDADLLDGMTEDERLYLILERHIRKLEWERDAIVKELTPAARQAGIEAREAGGDRAAAIRAFLEANDRFNEAQKRLALAAVMFRRYRAKRVGQQPDGTPDGPVEL